MRQRVEHSISMMWFRCLLTLALTLLATSNGNADDDRVMARELEAIGRAVAEAKALHFVVRVEFFQEATQTVPTFLRTMEVRRLGEKTLYRDPGLIMLANRNFAIVVDLKRREIHYQPDVQRGNVPTREAATRALDEALHQLEAQGTSLRYVGMAEGLVHLSASSSHGEIRKADLFLDVHTRLPIRVRYEYAPIASAPEARTEIRYEWLDATKLSLADFTKDTFVRIENGQVTPSDEYRSFQIITPRHSD